MEEVAVKSKHQPANEERRDFIKKSPLLGAGVATVTMAGTEAIADSGPPAEATPGDQGYRLTQHIVDYYKSADI